MRFFGGVCDSDYMLCNKSRLKLTYREFIHISYYLRAPRIINTHDVSKQCFLVESFCKFVKMHLVNNMIAKNVLRKMIM